MENPAVRGAARLRRWHRRAKLLALLAAAPVFQVTGCFPDPLGALNFEAQNLISGLLINALDIVIRNILRL